MARRSAQQLNIRSDFAHARVKEIAARTGMTATQIVEDALRGYVAPGEPVNVGRLVRKGPLLVLASQPGAKPIRTEELLAAIDDARDERLDDIMNAGRE